MAGSGKCASVEQLQKDLTVSGGINQQFVMGYFAPGFTAKCVTQEDINRECKWFDQHFTPSQLQFSQWLHQPVVNIRDSLTVYLEQLVQQLFDHFYSQQEQVSRSRREDRERLKVRAFVRAVNGENKRKDTFTVEDLLKRFFTVYTFLSPQSIVFGYARSILGVFEQASPEWYPYLKMVS